MFLPFCFQSNVLFKPNIEILVLLVDCMFFNTNFPLFKTGRMAYTSPLDGLGEEGFLHSLPFFRTYGLSQDGIAANVILTFFQSLSCTCRPLETLSPLMRIVNGFTVHSQPFAADVPA